MNVGCAADLLKQTRNRKECLNHRAIGVTRNLSKIGHRGRKKLVKIGQPSNLDLSLPTDSLETGLSNFYHFHATGHPALAQDSACCL